MQSARPVHPRGVLVPTFVETFGFVTLFFLASSPALAGVGEWSSQGPYGGPAEVVAVDPIHPEVLYAGLFLRGIFKSTDGGSSWRELDVGVPSLNVHALAIDPANPSIVYAGTSQNGLLKSVDGGESWLFSHSLASRRIADLVLAPDPPHVVYAATSVGVFRSQDGGAASWTDMSGELPPFINALLVARSSPSVVFVGTHSSPAELSPADL